MSDETPQNIPQDTAPETPEERDAAARVEAVLFATEAPLPQAKIAAATELTTRQVTHAIEQLNARYALQQASFRIERIAGGYQMLTLPEYHDVLSNLLATKKDGKLSQAALETLSIIAYRQPILRADIEAIRGVASGEVVRTLMERGLVKIVGRAEVLGRPMLYGTTKQFLETFGLGSLDDLPRSDELRGEESKAEAKTTQSSDDDAEPGTEENSDDEFEEDEEFQDEFDEEESDEFGEEDFEEEEEEEEGEEFEDEDEDER